MHIIIFLIRSQKNLFKLCSLETKYSKQKKLNVLERCELIYNTDMMGEKKKIEIRSRN